MRELIEKLRSANTKTVELIKAGESLTFSLKQLAHLASDPEERKLVAGMSKSASELMRNAMRLKHLQKKL